MTVVYYILRSLAKSPVGFRALRTVPSNGMVRG